MCSVYSVFNVSCVMCVQCVTHRTRWTHRTCWTQKTCWTLRTHWTRGTHWTQRTHWTHTTCWTHKTLCTAPTTLGSIDSSPGDLSAKVGSRSVRQSVSTLGLNLISKWLMIHSRVCSPLVCTPTTLGLHQFSFAKLGSRRVHPSVLELYYRIELLISMAMIQSI